MAWGTDDNSTAPPPVATDSRAGQQSSAPAPTEKKEASRPLSLLAERLGALEQSLTVVASEIGVSGMPQFKHLDPDKVYAEAVRQARQAVGQAQSDMLDRADRARANAAAPGVRLDVELRNVTGRLNDLDTRLVELMQHIDAMQRKNVDAVNRQGDEQRRLSPTIAGLHQRLDALESQVLSRPLPDTAPNAALQQRLDALEAQLHSQTSASGDGAAEWPFAGEDATGKPAQAKFDTAALQRDIEANLQRRVNETLSELEARLLQRLDERFDRLAQAAPPIAGNAAFGDIMSPPVTAGDVQGLHEAIATELAVMLARKAEYNEPMPLLAERNVDINPLAMTAAERAIVRLTHRIEKLENKREGDGGDSRRSTGLRPSSRSGRSLMGRLFEG